MELLCTDENSQQFDPTNDKKTVQAQKRLIQAFVERGVLIFTRALTIKENQCNLVAPYFLAITSTKRIGLFEIRTLCSADTVKQEVDRRQLFLRYGIKEYHIYDAHRCENDLDQVIDHFLTQVNNGLPSSNPVIQGLWDLD